MVTRLFFVAFTLLLPLWRHVVGVAPLILTSTAKTPATGTIFDAWNRWDARWYGDLAHLGYNLRGPDGFKNVAFFPLYALLTRTLHDTVAVVVHDVLGLALPDPLYPPYLVAGMIVANLCAVGALIFFYSLVRLDYGPAVARRAVTLLALVPPAMFLFAAYSEGTFLLCAIAFFYALRLERWWQAGLWGLLAGAARPPGALLLVPFLMAWITAHPGEARWLAARLRLTGSGFLTRLRLNGRTLLVRLSSATRALLARMSPARSGTHAREAHAPAALALPLTTRYHAGRTPRRRARDVGAGKLHAWRQPERRRSILPAGVRRAFLDAAPLLLIPLGLVLFMAFLARYFGNALWFSQAEKAWSRTFAPPWETLYVSVVWPLGDLLHGTLTAVDLYALHDLGYEIAGLALTWLAWRRLPRVQGVYLWLVWAVILMSPAMLTESRTNEPHHDVLMSLPRLLLMLFPLCTYLALHPRLYRRLVLLFALGLGLYTGMFLTGGWVS